MVKHKHMDLPIEGMHCASCVLSVNKTFENYRTKGNIVYFPTYYRCPESYGRWLNTGMTYFFGINKLTGEIVIPTSLKSKQSVFLDCMNSVDSDTFILSLDNKVYSYKISTDTLTQILPDNI